MMPYPQKTAEDRGASMVANKTLWHRKDRSIGKIEKMKNKSDERKISPQSKSEIS